MLPQVPCKIWVHHLMTQFYSYGVEHCCRHMLFLFHEICFISTLRCWCRRKAILNNYLHFWFACYAIEIHVNCGTHKMIIFSDCGKTLCHASLRNRSYPLVKISTSDTLLNSLHSSPQKITSIPGRHIKYRSISFSEAFLSTFNDWNAGHL